MIVRFTRARHDDRPHTFTCIRDDGSVTGMASTLFFVRHDLTHYAVETVLGLDEAFYGLLGKGWEIESFEERQPGTRKARALPEQAHFAERLVGALDMEVVAGMIDVRDLLGPSAFLPSVEQLDAIWGRKQELVATFFALAPGEDMELPFPCV